jgi:four helix bundle protein
LQKVQLPVARPSIGGGVRFGSSSANVTRVAGVRHFTELECWQLASELKREIYRLTDQPGVKRDARYCEQIRDAAAGAPRTIAEGFARRTHADFARFLDMSRSSLTECQNHLLDGVDRHHLAQDECDRLVVLAKRACGAVAALQRYLRGRS